MGRFELSDIPLGIYKLTVSYIGYAKEERHSSISNEDDSLYFEVNLHIPDIKLTCDFSSEKYHRALREAFPNFDNVIDLQISDVLNTSEVDQEKSFFIELRIKNNADVPVYLFKDYLCFKRINPTIVDADLDTVRLHCILFDCVGEKQLYLPSDLIEIEPQDTRKVKAQKLNFYLYDAFVPGTYKVKIMYEYELPHYIPEPDREYAEMEASIKECYCKALRGSFHSNWFQWTKTNFEARFFV